LSTLKKKRKKKEKKKKEKEKKLLAEEQIKDKLSKFNTLSELNFEVIKRYNGSSDEV
jgi:hypothetical protein